MLLPYAVAASNTLWGPLNYMWPYNVASMVGSTLFHEGRVSEYLKGKWLAYVATISFALYILHPAAMWWAPESKLLKYALRAPELAAVFGLAHLDVLFRGMVDT